MKKIQMSLASLSLLLVVITGVHSMDEFMSCDRYYEGKRTARMIDQIPCDMTKNTYCQYKGSAYPEAAIWRFKEENRALMRRLYGDLESNSVYREMRSANLHNLPSEEHSIFSNMEYNIRMGSGLATVKSARNPIVKPGVAEHRLPSPSKKVLVKKKRKNQTPPPTPGPSLAQATTETELDTALTSDDSTGEAQNATIMPDLILGLGNVSSSEAMVYPEQNLSSIVDMDTTTQNDHTLVSTETSTDSIVSSSPKSVTNSPLPTTTSTPAIISDTAGVSPSLSDIFQEVNLDSLEQLVEEMLPSVGVGSDVSPGPIEATNEQTSFKEEEFEQEAGFDYEYVEENEETPESKFTGPSMNACPVKEEVFAPYWANNTRDQVLALLNLYPFEQYIHMETCQFPEEQMMCRKGCRCEQQYRLHRLLAFDPNNECRGIFSDWFRFPSYCVCKCYGFPEEFLDKKKRNPKLESRDEATGRQTKDIQGDSIQNIPAFLPYEAKQALLRDINRNQRTLDAEPDVNHIPQRPIPPPTTRLGSPETQDSANHFLYGNTPIVEYQFSDGTGGSIKKTPR